MLQLSGTIPAYGCWVVGGPNSSADNANPTFDVAGDFDSDLQNSGSTADGVALFDVPASQVTTSTLPVGVVLYGGSNVTGLLGPDGLPAAVDAPDAGSGKSVERAVELWAVQTAPTPNDCSAAVE